MGLPATGIEVAREREALGLLVEARDMALTVAKMPGHSRGPKRAKHESANARNSSGSVKVSSGSTKSPTGSPNMTRCTSTLFPLWSNCLSYLRKLSCYLWRQTRSTKLSCDWTRRREASQR